MNSSSHAETLQRIKSALESARQIFARFTLGEIEAEYKAGHDPVTEADKAVDAVLRQELLREGEGWLSEESVDDFSRLEKKRVWIVDPLDGTREFVDGIPEFCVSVAMVEDGIPIAGGICNPATNEVFLGSLDSGVTTTESPPAPASAPPLKALWSWPAEAKSSAESGSDSKRLQSQCVRWDRWPTNWRWSRLVLADVTFTLTPKHEWDIAGGAALVSSAGGFVSTLESSQLLCNRKSPLLPGLVVGGPFLRDELFTLVNEYLPANSSRSR